MSEQPPKVSLGLPVYNGDNYLEEAIQTALTQTYTDFELIISDNASTDQTQAICEKFAAQDRRIRYYRVETNYGAAWNFNRVLQLARGKYFKWIAHDDLIAPEFLERCVAVLEKDDSVVLCYPKVKMIDENGEFIQDYNVKLNSDSVKAHERYKDLLLAWSLCYEIFGVIRTAALINNDGMPDYGHGDGVLLARLGLMGRFHEVPERLFFSRQHDQQSQKVYGLSEQGGNDYHAYTVWFSPNRAGRLMFPSWNILKEFYVSIWQFPISMVDRFFCHFYIAWWVRKHYRELVKDVIYSLKHFRRVISKKSGRKDIVFEG